MKASYRKKIEILLLMCVPLFFFSTNVQEHYAPEVLVKKIIKDRELDKVDQELQKYKMLTKINLSYLDWKWSQSEFKKNK